MKTAGSGRYGYSGVTEAVYRVLHQQSRRCILLLLLLDVCKLLRGKSPRAEPYSKSVAQRVL